MIAELVAAMMLCGADSSITPTPGGAERSAILWNIDSVNSTVSFRVSHFVIMSVTGYFRRFAGTIAAGRRDFSGAVVSATAEAGSVDTDNGARDADLRGAGFLDVGRRPALSLSGQVRQARGDTLEMAGTLEIRGVCKDLRLTVVPRAPRGLPVAGRAAFVARTTISRSEYGVSGSPLIVGDSVEIWWDIELVQAIRPDEAD